MILAAVIAVLTCVAVKEQAPQPRMPVVEARVKVQQPMCVLPYRWFHTCDEHDCPSRRPRSYA